jgi:NitT/TauT family transport system permease protein
MLPIALAAMAGARTIDARLARVAKSFGASRRQVFVSLVVPSSVPFLLTGCRIGVGRAMIGVVAAEFFAARAGIGHLIDRAGTSFRTDEFFVGVIVLAIAGVALTELIGGVERRVEAWRPKVGAA